MAATSWHQARKIAADMDVAPPHRVGLSSAIGTVLAQPVAALCDLPPVPAAQFSGWAVCGIGPWSLSGDTHRLIDGEAVRVGQGAGVPDNTLGVLSDHYSVVEETEAGPLIMVGEAGVPATRPGMIKPGFGIVDPGTAAASGSILLKPGGLVTAGTIALAAAAGVDELTIVPPATVAPVIMGHDLLPTGPPRRGRDRDVVAPLVPSWVMGHGGRCLPEQEGTRDPRALADILDSAGADIVVVTSTAEPGVAAGVADAVRQVRAEILIDRLATRPAADVLLAELRDGRRILALPREPAAAVVVLALMLTPMMTSLSGRPPGRWPTVMLRDGVATGNEERAVAVGIERGELADLGHVFPWSGPHGLAALAEADGIAFLDPGRGSRGDSVPVVELPGRTG